jgi:DNA-binding SARP family transcriptional activator/TolB-like protein
MSDDVLTGQRLKLTTFGGLSIRREDGGELPPVVTRRQPLALLAFLAVAGAGVGVSRDRLCAIFWPESDTDRARNALKQTIFSLRRDLKQPELIVGTTDLRLNPQVICSDVLEFAAALAAKDFERAANLYTGSFLDGVHLRNSPEFERWLDDERARLAGQADSAMRAAARVAGSRGDTERAVASWRRIAALNPLDTDATIELMQALAQRGDRAGALRQAKRHESYVREELGAAPSSQLGELVSKLNTRERPPAAPAQPLVAREKPPLDEPDAKSRRATNTFGRRVVGLTLVGIAVTIGIIWFGIRRASVSSAASRTTQTTLFVAPFSTDPADSSIAFLHDGMVDLLSSTLAGDSLGPRIIDPSTVFASFKDLRHASPNPSLESVLDVARRAGASRVVRGDVVRAKGDVFVTATMFDANGKSLGKADVSGNLDSLPGLVDKLAAQLVAIQMDERAVTSDLLAGTSLAAVKSYLSGRAAFRRGAYDDAESDQKRALLTDSSFALAALELGRIAGWLGDDAARRWAYERAWVNKERLRPLDQALITAMLGPRYPKGSTRAEWLAAWEHVAEIRPDEPEGWYEAGDLIFHNPWLGTATDREGLARARTFFARALNRAPDYAPALQHLLQLTAHDQDTASVRRLMASVQAAHLNRDVVNYLQWRAAIALGDSAGQKNSWARFRPEDLLALQWVAMTGEEDAIALEEAANALQVRLSGASTDRERVDALLALHALALNRGKLREAAHWTQTLMFDPLGSDVARRLEVLDVVYGGMPREATAVAAVSWMEAARSPLTPTADAREQWSIDRCVLGHWYLAGGEYGRVGRIAAALQQFGSEFPNELWSEGASTCALVLNGFVAVHDHKPGAGKLLRSIDERLSSGAYVTSRLVWDITVIGSAHLFEVAGDTARAQNAIRRRNWFYRWPHYLARQLLELGRLSAIRGDIDTEKIAYAHYLRLRTDPDSSLKDEVARVKSQLATSLRK